jgi:hypothetical protein
MTDKLKIIQFEALIANQIIRVHTRLPLDGTNPAKILPV